MSLVTLNLRIKNTKGIITSLDGIAVDLDISLSHFKNNIISKLLPNFTDYAVIYVGKDISQKNFPLKHFGISSDSVIYLFAKPQQKSNFVPDDVNTCLRIFQRVLKSPRRLNNIASLIRGKALRQTILEKYPEIFSDLTAADYIWDSNLFLSIKSKKNLQKLLNKHPVIARPLLYLESEERKFEKDAPKLINYWLDPSSDESNDELEVPSGNHQPLITPEYLQAALQPVENVINNDIPLQLPTVNTETQNNYANEIRHLIDSGIASDESVALQIIEAAGGNLDLVMDMFLEE